MREDGYETHANILAHSCGLLTDKWRDKYGERFDYGLDQLLPLVYVEDGNGGQSQ